MLNTIFRARLSLHLPRTAIRSISSTTSLHSARPNFSPCIHSLSRSSLAQYRTSLSQSPLLQTSRSYAKGSGRSTRPRNEQKHEPPAVVEEHAVMEEQPRLLERLKSKGGASTATELPMMTVTERLWRPFLFTALVTAGCVWYGYHWHPSKREDRWFPDLPQSVATIVPIIALNAAVWFAWKIPLPITWRMLNRYFISVPGFPYTVSMLGSAFSHQSITHLAMNMFVLYSVGTSLCEQIGPGYFTSLYISGGVISSFASLAYNVVRSRFHVYSLGASGAIMSVVGCYAYLNPDSLFFIIFLPFLQFKARTLIMGAAAFETLGLIRGWHFLDHMAHLSGLGWGVGFGYLLHKELKRRIDLMYKSLSPQQREEFARRSGR